MIWLLLGVLTALLLFLFYRPNRFDEDKQQALNLSIYKQRYQEITNSEFDKKAKDTLLLELDKELLAQQNKTNKLAKPSTAPVWFIPLLSCIVIVGAYYFYTIWGAQKQLATTVLIAKASQSVLSDSESKELIAGMRYSAARDAKNLEWLYLLGQFLNADAQYTQSAEVFTQLLNQLPEDATQDRAATLSDLAQARFFANKQQATEEDYALLQESLNLEPNRMSTLGIAGMIAFELERFAEAITHWRKIWQQLRPGLEANALEKGIRTSAMRLREQGKEIDISWLTPIKLNIAISLSEKARKASQDEDVVFVIARAKNGGNIPITAQKIQVKNLPTVVSLSQQQVMLPNVQLSDYPSLDITARLSKTGQVKAQKGDWLGELLEVNPKENKLLNLEINKLVAP